jgi:hypothetical protein
MSVYIIRSSEPSLHDIYIGSCKDMRKRMITHKSNCYNEKRKEYNFKVYQFIRANGGWSNFVMEEIDTCDVERLYQMEQEYIDKLNPSLNSQRAYKLKNILKNIIKNVIKNGVIKIKNILKNRRKNGMKIIKNILKSRGKNIVRRIKIK